MTTPAADPFAPQPAYSRFSKSDRVQHIVMLVSFLVLTVTGLPQKFIYLNNGQLDNLIDMMGGIEAVRLIHRYAATALMVVTVFHLLAVAERVLVRRVSLSMLPRYQDVLDALQAVRYNLGLANARPRMDRFTWEEKVEYWSLIWGTIVMIATGFMLWNPVATARFLPGQFIPAAQVVHGGEALLAILAVLVWHFYSVHLRHFNRSMFTGQMSEHEMLDEHPLELERMKAGAAEAHDPSAIARRERLFRPVAALVAALLLAGIYWFVTFEQTAITTLPPK
jgi:cytochrome b subunit of formate dehydrogenase